MESTTTRISDLPENISLQMPNSFTQNNTGGFDQGSSTNYIPMNIHPNPYGISAQNPIMPNPQQPNVQQIQQVNQMEQLSKQHQAELQNMQQMRLPSRDIPLDTSGYLNDEEIQANYIPKTKLTKDYIREHEDKTEKIQREHEEKKHRENKVDDILTEFQIPVFIAVLFFIFQLPIINSMIFKRFSFLSIHNLDGNFNFYGLLLKSMLFGSVYYSIQKCANFIIEF